MKIKTRLIALLFTISLIYCGNAENNTDTHLTNSDTITKVLDTSAEDYYPDKKFMRQPNAAELKQYALDVLADKQNPGDNLFTYAMFDSICSPNPETRKFYYKVFINCLNKIDGIVSESVGGYIMIYLEQYPNEAIANYAELDGKNKDNYDSSLAYEFYVTATDIKSYKGEIQEYFDSIRKKFHSESKLLPTIQKLENTVLKLVGEYMAEDSKQ
jgi:hypothetical protein